jgi:pimeloyl-ACP methyl ester carboxylesterase
MVRVVAMRRALVSPERPDGALHRAVAAAPDAPRGAAARIELEAVADALRQGSRATAQELALIKREWTFPLSEVTTPVHLWHGARDRNAPIAFARRLARELPDATCTSATHRGTMSASIAAARSCLWLPRTRSRAQPTKVMTDSVSRPTALSHRSVGTDKYTDRSMRNRKIF